MQDSVRADRIEADGLTGVPPEAAVRSLAREVVVRLSRARAASPEVPPDQVALFCAALSGNEPEQAERVARAALEAGLSFDQLCETYLAPAARRLGTLWEADEMTFAEVTLAANRLFGLLRRLAHRPAPRAASPFVVFAAPPGEEHILGVSMAAERARGVGWDVVLHIGLDHDTLVARIAESAPDVIGLSLSSRRALLPTTRLVVALRVTVPSAPIVLSGPGVAEVQQPIPGVDVMTPDFDVAMAAMARLAG